MTVRNIPVNASRPFYGWTALAGSAIQQFTGAGAFIFSFGIFLPIMCTELNWNRAVVSLGMSLGLLCFGLLGPLIGITVAKFGPRIHIILGNLVLALGLAGMCLIRETWQFYLLYCIMGVGSGIAHFIAGSAIANNWFIKKRSLAMGIFNSSLGVGGFVFPLLTSSLISYLGWQTSWLVLAGIVLLGGPLLSGLILVRNKPEDMGQFPDGINPEPSQKVGMPEHLSRKNQETTDWTTRQALLNPTIWLIIGFLAASTFSMGIMLAHQVAYVEDMGFSPMVAATTTSVVSALNIIGMFGLGVLALRYNIRYLACISITIILSAMVILLTTKNIGAIYIYAILFGVGNGAMVTIETTIVSTYYGRTNYTRILGVIVPVTLIFEAVGPIIAGSIYVATGKYTVSLVIVIVFILIGLIFAFLARPPKFTSLKRPW